MQKRLPVFRNFIAHIRSVGYAGMMFSALLTPGCGSAVTEEQMLPVRNDEPLKKNPDSGSYLALGDSYTIGEGVSEQERFPVQLEKKLNNNGIPVKLERIIARTGWTTDELAGGIRSSSLSSSYQLVTLLIGVNNQYRGRDTAEYRKQFRELLETAVSLAGGLERRVIVISIPDYGVTPFVSEESRDRVAREIDAFNRINRQEAENRGTKYVDITEISRQALNRPELIAPDRLHPSGEMYRLWVERIYPIAVEILR
jgi:lysophospholipase L1-like esterase